MTVQIYATLLWTPVRGDTSGNLRDALSTLGGRRSRSHVHGLLVFRVGGRRVPSMGHVGPDNVCLGTWLPELLAARRAVAVEGGAHVFDEGEANQPAFRFERRGGAVLLTILPSLLSGGEGNAEWRNVPCDHAAFAAEVIQFAKRFRRDLRRAAPAAFDAWWSEHVRDGSAIDDGEPTKPVLEIDGARFSDRATFQAEVSERLIPGSAWGGNLDAFNDILRGGFGTPDGGFVLRWKNAELSRQRLSSEPRLFDDLVEIIRVHGEGGQEAEDGVELILD